MREQNRKLQVQEYNLLITNLWFQPGEFECDEKYDACDGDQSPKRVVLRPRKPKPANRTKVPIVKTPVAKGGGSLPLSQPEPLLDDLGGEAAETLVLVLIAIATVLLLALLGAFILVKVTQRFARMKFYKMRQDRGDLDNAQELNEIVH